MNQKVVPAYAEIDQSLSPIIIIQINPIYPTSQQFAEFLTSVLQLIKKLKEGAIIINVSKARLLSSDNRRVLRGWRHQNGNMIQNNLRALCYIQESFFSMIALSCF